MGLKFRTSIAGLVLLLMASLVSAAAAAVDSGNEAEQSFLQERPIFAIAGSLDLQPGVYWRPGDRDRYPASPREPDVGFRHPALGFGLQGFSAHCRDGTDSIAFVTVNAGIDFARGWSLNFEGGLSPGSYRDGRRSDWRSRNQTFDENGDDDDSDGSGRLRAEEEIGLIRWTVLTRSRLSPYVEAGIGGLHATRSFPSIGHSDNWLVVAGAGIRIRLDDHWIATAGGRFARLSGGDLFAAVDQGSEGIQYFGGLTYAW